MLNSIIDFFYRHPKSVVNRYKRFGGYSNYYSMERQNKRMAKASLKLPPIYSYKDGLQLHFLTGKKYLYQTLFCIQSLAKAGLHNINIILVDDGTFNFDIINRINRQLPGATIITQEIIANNLDKIIPARLFPVLHHKRKVYPHIKKLTDIHTIPGNAWKLVLDSDMLFWKKPQAIVDWLEKPQYPLYMHDCQNSYGYSKQLMETLIGTKISDRINVGVIGLNSTAIDWQKLEDWITILEEKEGASYYLEQALTAMLIGDSKVSILPVNEYIVNPDIEVVNKQQGTLHHYVDLSKEGYFKQAWKKI
jgi:hypothetical protein